MRASPHPEKGKRTHADVLFLRPPRVGTACFLQAAIGSFDVLSVLKRGLQKRSVFGEHLKGEEGIVVINFKLKSSRRLAWQTLRLVLIPQTNPGHAV